MARSGAARAVGSAGQRGMTLADRISSILARYAHDAAANGLAAETAHEVRRRMLDTLGVAVAGFDEPAAVAARRYAEGSAGRVTVWGTQAGASVEAAGFANGVAVRCLDFNDTYLSSSRSIPPTPSRRCSRAPRTAGVGPARSSRRSR